MQPPSSIRIQVCKPRFGDLQKLSLWTSVRWNTSPPHGNYALREQGHELRAPVNHNPLFLQRQISPFMRTRNGAMHCSRRDSVKFLGKEDWPQCSRMICHHFLGANYKLKPELHQFWNLFRGQRQLKRPLWANGSTCHDLVPQL